MRDTIDQFVSEISKLQAAKDLLEKVWLEIGPYRGEEVTQETWRKVNKFFEFNDNE